MKKGATRQVLQWMGEWEPASGIRPAKAKPVLMPFKVVRVWTLFNHTDFDSPPQLPFVTTHGKTAFLEDYIHDWNVRGGKFHYYSRVMDRPVWLLLEVE